MTMSKKDKAQEQQPKVMTLADAVKFVDCVTVNDDKRLRVTAEDKETLKARVEEVQKALADNFDITISPVYGNAEAIGCVWNDIVATPKK